MSRAAVSDATTQPRSSRPSTSGRMPCGSRAAYSVCSSIQMNEKAPLIVGSSSAAFSSSDLSGWCARSAVTRLVSLVDTGAFFIDRSSTSGLAARSATRAARSRVLVRLPLCARAIEPVSVGRNVGWALCQVLAPVVE